MNAADRQVEKEAIAWRLRLRDADGGDWLRFTEWLEADPAHAECYDAVTLAEADIPETIGRRPSERYPMQDIPAPALRSRTWPISGRLAAVLSAIAAIFIAVIGVQYSRQPGDRIVRTGPGERRSLALADGTKIELNGGTQIVLEGRTHRSVRLVSGEASFAVRHDPSAPFEVAAGETRLRDVGTVFNVVRGGGAVDVAVAEGAVLLNPNAEDLTLRAGEAAHDPEGNGMTTRRRVDPSAVGGWRIGRLVFEHATLSQVAASIARSTGVPVTAAPAVAARGFDGVIVVPGDRELLFRRLGPLLGVAVEREGRTVRLAPLPRAEG